MNDLRRTARLTGLWYLGLAITGALGFLLVRPELFNADDPAATLQNLVEHEGLARLGVVLELGIVVTQALAAAWFYRLFRSVDAFQAGGIAAFGLINSVAILASAGLLFLAVDVATGTVAVGDTAGTVQSAFALSGSIWQAAGIFFGLWLIPMGTLVLRSSLLPAGLGWVLVVGGVGYVLGTFLAALGAGATLATVVTLPASVGEFWMIGYLLLFGVRDRAVPAT